MSIETFTIYSKDNCPYCDKAKQLLLQEGLNFKEVRVAENDSCTREDLFERTGLKTFPQIFYHQQVIGGYSDLKQIYDQNGFQQFR